MHFKILSLDDSLIIANHLKKLFQDIKEVALSIHAFTISEAMGLIKSDDFDIVILDIALKNENGIDFLAFLKNNHPDIKVIMLSNQSEMFYKSKSKEMGADYFLDKSYEFDILPDIIKKLSHAGSVRKNPK